MRIIATLFFSLMIIFVGATVQGADDGPSPDVPELTVLQNYAGTWDIKFDDPNFAKGETTAQWVLGGRFLEQRGKTEMKDGQHFEIKTLYTYDSERKQYRSWTFLSSGSVTETEMKWNSQSKSMTSTSRPDARGGNMVITADFSEKGKERWKFVFKDAQGNTVGEMSGENTRKNAEAGERKE